MIEQFRQFYGAADRQINVGRLAPFGKAAVEKRRFRFDSVAERFKQLRRQFLVVPCPEGRERGGEGKGRVGELLLFVAAPLHGGAEHAGNGIAHERRGRVGTVVDIIKKTALAAAELAARQINGVDIEKQRRRGAFVADLGIKHIRFAVAECKLLRPVGVLVQQKA